MKQTFEEWMDLLKKLCKDYNCEWMLSAGQECFTEAYEDDMTPLEYIEEEFYAGQ